MLIRKKPPRPHALGEPLLYNDHPLPVTRRDFIAAGLHLRPRHGDRRRPGWAAC